MKKELRSKLVKFLLAAEDLHAFLVLRANVSKENGHAIEGAIDSVVRVVREVDDALPEEGDVLYGIGTLGGEQFTFGPTRDLSECLRQRPDAGLAIFIGNGTTWGTPA